MTSLTRSIADSLPITVPHKTVTSVHVHMFKKCLSFEPAPGSQSNTVVAPGEPDERLRDAAGQGHDLDRLAHLTG